MAACGSLHHIFETPLSDSPTTLLESFSSSWNQIQPLKSSNIDNNPSSTLTEMFGELHFKENNNVNSPIFSSPSMSSSSSSLTSPDVEFDPKTKIEKNEEEMKKMNGQKSPSQESFSSNYSRSQSHKSCDSFSSMNSESLQLCTEGLGFESSDEVEELFKESPPSDHGYHEDEENITVQEEKISFTKQYFPVSEISYNNNCCGGELGFRRSRSTSVGGFPPPISCISNSGKPWVCFKSYRHNGRFVLKEIRIPTQEFLHAHREDGRLKLHFVMPNDEILGEEDNDDDDDLSNKIEEQEEEEDHLDADAARDSINKEGNDEAKTNN
ncbi:hypothetical protein FF1_006719 [Malus domestica]|uniref:protein FAF-like, chloroplastic n=1 Tax=Malus domestica TaxID=3750 RepID=UPI0004986E90|nr:protein FAF-like, chloroplastic [Malus domestica]